MTGQQPATSPERTCFRCDGEFRVASEDRRVYCPACRAAYGFPAPSQTDFAPGAQLALFVAGSSRVKGREVLRSA